MNKIRHIQIQGHGRAILLCLMLFLCINVGAQSNGGIVIGGDGLLSEIDAAIAVGHLQGTLSAQRLLLGFGLRVGFLITRRGIIILAQGEKLVALLHGGVGPASSQSQHRYGHQYDFIAVHTLFITRDITNYCMDGSQ